MTHIEVYKWFELYFSLYARVRTLPHGFQMVKTASVSDRPME